MLINRFTDPTDIDSARYFIHQHIFKIIGEVEMNPSYDRNAVTELSRSQGLSLEPTGSLQNGPSVKSRKCEM